MSANRSHTLVGERCPAAGIAKAAENRNNCGVSRSLSQPVRAASGRTAQERTGSVDTRLTQRGGFPFGTRPGGAA